MEIRERVESLIKKKEMDVLKKEVNEVHVADLLNLMKELKREEQVIVFRLLNKDLAIEVFEKLDPNFQRELISAFAENEVIEIIENLDFDDRARLLDELPAKVAKRILNKFNKEEREMIADLLGYAPETAGRIMNPEYISLKKDLTVEEAMDSLRKNNISRDTAYTIYITDQERRLEGAISLRVLVMADKEKNIEDIMYDNPVSVNTYTDQEEVAKLLQQQDLAAVPVVDRENRLVGLVTFDDAMDVLEEETTEDILDKAGFSDLGQKESDRSQVLVSGSLLEVLKVRLPYLILTLIGGILAGTIIEGYEDSLEAITALAFFIPVIMDMGGNVGTQSSTIFARALVIGQINVKKFASHWLREIKIGITMGVLLGTLAGFIATVWQGNPMLGVVVGISLASTLTLATALGFLVPYMLVKLGFDQAAGSDPIITTAKDITGLLIYFFLASQLLGHML
ncbi:magnesium transporter [Natroniella acetigena]|uniref:magnesium transporter n=1 Tax=Natroniella acetigena TaxID=52004 RepID=UPI00200B3897|nr:magnesium transporter [Natroniella acetigena]MCK8827624.1 magnesium transporter [Natroniella acetigena]